MVALCERCGTELDPAVVFCRSCGRRTTESWLVPKGAGDDARPRVANVFSTLAVFCGVVALAIVFLGVAAMGLAAIAGVRGEPSSRFAIVVSGLGTALGLAFKTLVLDAG